MSTTAVPLYKRILFKIVVAICILYCLIWIISSPLIKHFAKAPLAEYGLTLSDDTSIRFNPFLTRLSISDLTLQKDNNAVFITEHLTLQLALHKLPFDIIQLEVLSINGVTLKVEKSNNDLFVAGINTTTPKESTTSDENTQPTKTSEQGPLPYQVRLNTFTLSNTLIDVMYEGVPHKLDIKELLISNIRASQTQQAAMLQLTSLLDNAQFNVSSEVNLENNNGNITSDIEINEYSLAHIAHFIEPLDSLAGALSFGINPVITLLDNQITITASNTTLTTDKAQARTKDQQVHLNNLSYAMTDLSLSLNNNNIQHIAGTSQLSLTNAVVETLNETVTEKTSEALTETLDTDTQVSNKVDKILSFSQLNVNNITPTMQPEDATTPSVLVESIHLNDLLFSHNTSVDLPPIATINQISATDIEGSATALSINDITIDSITSHVILNQDKILANLVNLTSTNAEKTDDKENTTPIEETQTAQQTSPEPEQPFHISLNAFNVINQNQIDFIDNSVDPAYTRKFMIDKVTVGKLSNTSTNKELETPIELIGRSNEYAKFAFNGFIKPFATQKTYYIKGDLNELSLPAVSTYMKDALEFELTSGQLNTELEVTLIDDALDGDVSISVNGLETSAVNNHETTNIKGQVAIPFNVALDMLKDGDGNLVLDIPLSGKTSDPSFGISSFIALITKKAALSATKDYVMTTFVPYANIVSVAMTAGEFILKVRFEDMLYQPKQITLDKQQHEYMAQFIALMKDKEDTRVKICAVSTPADINLPAQQKLSSEQIKSLKEIGHQREKAFKAHAVSQQIESSRILFCTPQIDNSAEAQPKMVISV